MCSFVLVGLWRHKGNSVGYAVDTVYENQLHGADERTMAVIYLNLVDFRNFRFRNISSHKELSWTISELQSCGHSLMWISYEQFKHLLKQEAFEKVGPIRHCEPPLTLPFTRCRYCRTQHCRTMPANRCLQRQRQLLTEGTAMAPWNGPKKATIRVISRRWNNPPRAASDRERCLFSMVALKQVHFVSFFF